MPTSVTESGEVLLTENTATGAAAPVMTNGETVVVNESSEVGGEGSLQNGLGFPLVSTTESNHENGTTAHTFTNHNEHDLISDVIDTAVAAADSLTGPPAAGGDLIHGIDYEMALAAADNVDMTSSSTTTGMPQQQQTFVAVTAGSNGTNTTPTNSQHFPQKLHQMLDDCSSNGEEWIVSWIDNGRAFKVHNIPEFVQSILPRYFRQSKYKSFQRQLNLYSVTRISEEGPSKGGYRHPNLVRGRSDLCHLISKSGSTAFAGGSLEDDDETGHGNDEVIPQSPVKNRIAVAKQGQGPKSPTRRRASPKTKSEPAGTTATAAASIVPAPTTSTTTPTAPLQTPNTYQEPVMSSSCRLSESQFQYKLHEMLDWVEQQQLQHIVSWNPQGNGFRVHDIDGFVDNVMKRFFKQSKFRSFQRQLNVYDFYRIDDGPYKGGYAHKFFVKGRKDLLRNIIRIRIKGTGKPRGSTVKSAPSAAVATPAATKPKSKAAKAKKAKAKKPTMAAPQNQLGSTTMMPMQAYGFPGGPMVAGAPPQPMMMMMMQHPGMMATPMMMPPQPSTAAMMVNGFPVGMVPTVPPPTGMATDAGAASAGGGAPAGGFQTFNPNGFMNPVTVPFNPPPCVNNPTPTTNVDSSTEPSQTAEV